MNVYDMETVRGIILGTIEYRKCPICEGTGFQNWDADGNDIKAGRRPNIDRDDGECDNCDGLGFILREKD